MTVTTLYMDEQILVVDKPSGLLVHRGWANDPVTLVDVVSRMLGGARVHPVHRLDRPTSGVLVFGLTPDAASALGRQSQDDCMRKDYLALVRGWPPDEGTIDHPVPKRKAGPKLPSVSRYRTLARVETEPREVSLVQVTITRGRTHQVRRHMRHIHHPVIGDSNYGENRLNRAFAEAHGLTRLALHAFRVTLLHPRTNELATFTAPLPEDLVAPLRSMGFDPASIST